MRGPGGRGKAQVAVSLSDTAGGGAGGGGGGGRTGPSPRESARMGRRIFNSIVRTVTSAADSAMGLITRGDAEADATGSSAELNAFVTFVSLPWETLIEAVLVTQAKPKIGYVTE